MPDSTYQHKPNLPTPSPHAAETGERVELPLASPLSYPPATPEPIPADRTQLHEGQRMTPARHACTRPATRQNGDLLPRHAACIDTRAILSGIKPPDTPPEAFGPYRDMSANLGQAHDAIHAAVARALGGRVTLKPLVKRILVALGLRLEGWPAMKAFFTWAVSRSDLRGM
jgi:hypothetical protein